MTQNAMVKSDFRAMATHFVNILAFLYFLIFAFLLFLTENATISRISKNDAERTGQSDFRTTATHFVNIFVLLLIFEPFPLPQLLLHGR